MLQIFHAWKRKPNEKKFALILPDFSPSKQSINLLSLFLLYIFECQVIDLDVSNHFFITPIKLDKNV